MSWMAETFCQEVILPLTMSARSLGVTRYSCSISRLTAEQKPYSIVILGRLAEVGPFGTLQSRKGQDGQGQGRQVRAGRLGQAG